MVGRSQNARGGFPAFDIKSHELNQQPKFFTIIDIINNNNVEKF